MNQLIKRIALLLAVLMLLSSLTVGASAAPAQLEPVGDPVQTVDSTEPALTDPTEAAEAPAFTSAENKAEGAELKWNAVEGASAYELYLHSDEAYELLTRTAELSYLHTPLESGATYLYNIRALDAEGQYLTEYAAADFANTFYAPPVISSVKATDNGVSLTWNAAEGVERYRVYRATDSAGWKRIGETEEASYTDTAAVSGTTYRYTVRCLSADGERLLSYFNDGKSISYVKTPSITSISNTPTGAKITWEKPAGAAKIRVYYMGSDGWVRFTETADTSYVHDNLKGGETYVYTVRGVDSKGNFVTEFDREGWSNTFIEPPVISSLTNTSKGIEIRWNAPKGAENYRVYYYGKTGWKKLAETADTYYLDTDVKSGSGYRYTVRCITPDGSGFTSYHNAGKTVRYVATPAITSMTNTDGGTKISWKMPAGAEKIRVYYLKDNAWVRLTETADSNCVVNKLTSGKSYTYTLRCVDSKGNFTSDYNREGWNNTYIKPPVISSLTNVEKGIEIRWGALEGAEKYRIYYKNAKGNWVKMAETTEPYYLDTDVKSGNHYTYTVRCINEDGSRFTSYHNDGKKTRFIAMPKITSISNTATGAKITWEKPAGATKFRVYYKTDSGWTRIGESSTASYTHDKLKNGAVYTYTVRCVDSKGNFVSDFSRDGWSNTFVTPPALPTVSAADEGNHITWKAVDGIESYRLYRKTYGGSWSRLCDSVEGTSFDDSSAAKNTLYAYTLRCLDDEGEVVSDYIANAPYYYNGKLANGSITVGSNKLYFENGFLRKGYQTIDGKTYYYNANGVIEKNGVVGSASEGYCYADKNGVIDYTYRNGVTSGGYDWNILDGKAYKVSSDKDRTLFRALKLVYKVTDRSMTKAQKLKACFNYLKTADYTEKNPRIPDYTGMDWPIIYANDIFVDGVGNCLSFAAAFAYMAKAIGYDNVYGCHSGGHGWAEINGLVYDPEWSMHNFKYSYYGMTYSEPCDVPYASGIAPGLAWMHIKI